MSMLRCENLKKAFGGIQALDGVSVQFPASGITAIIGPNGAGKTTLLNVLSGFLRADSGRYYLGDRDTTHLPPHKIARLGLARTFQNLRLIMLVPVLENVLLARPHQRGEKLFYALTRIGVAAEESANKQRAMETSNSLACKERRTRPLANCPTASKNCSRWRSVSPPSRPSCFSMNPSPA